MALEKIIGKRNPGKDEELVKQIHLRTNELDRIDKSRKLAVNNATRFLDERYATKSAARGPALLIGIFALGAITVAALWMISTYVPFKGL